jgi:hypothetical protein
LYSWHKYITSHSKDLILECVCLADVRQAFWQAG